MPRYLVINAKIALSEADLNLINNYKQLDEISKRRADGFISAIKGIGISGEDFRICSDRFMDEKPRVKYSQDGSINGDTTIDLLLQC